jgi:hypothetical protein
MAVVGFQTQIYNQPAIGIEGDWASANPYGSMLTSAGGFVAGPLGVIVGRFAWADAYGVVRNAGGDGRVGFVQADQPALITTWLVQSTMTVPPGLEMTLFDSGDFLCRFASGALVGQKVYANYADGTAWAAATATPPAAGSSTGTIAAGTASVTGYITLPDPFAGEVLGSIMTVTVIGSGVLYPGGILAGSGVTTGTQILSQLSGTPGGVGTYELSIGQVVNSAGTPGTITETYGLFTSVSALSGVYGVGDILAGSGGGGVTTGTQITALGTGTGGYGTYIVNPTQAVTSSTIKGERRPLREL